MKNWRVLQLDFESSSEFDLSRLIRTASMVDILANFKCGRASFSVFPGIHLVMGRREVIPLINLIALISFSLE